MSNVRIGLLTHLNQELFILDSGVAGSEMELGLKDGQMEQSILEIGKTIGHTAKANLYILMAICMKAIGSMIKLTGRVYTSMQMVLDIKAIGRMISSTDGAKKVGLTGLLL
jgi:hypothetical protein